MRRIFFSFLALFLGITKSKKKETKTVIILIDGLSYDSLSYAIQKRKCPTIARLIKNKYVFQKYFCELPAATTATEALLFYGTNANIPGFTWYDRALNSFVRGNRSQELSLFEDSFPKKRELIKDGSVIMSVYTGGATQLVLSGRNLRFPKTVLIVKLLQYLSLGILYPLQFIRTVWLTLKTAFLYRNNNRRESQKIFETIFLGQFSCFLTEIEIYRGTPRIFVDFLLYDEYAHEYGPTHISALSALHLIDRYIHRIQKTIQASGIPYEIIILSDHGQSPSIPYDEKKQQTLIDLQTAFLPAKPHIVKTYGTVIQPTDRETIYAVPAGSTLQLYFSQSLTKPYFEEEINNKYPNCIQNLIQQPGFGWLLVRVGDESAKLIGKHGSIQFTIGHTPVISGAPFGNIPSSSTHQIMTSFMQYAYYHNNGDIVLFGNTTNTGEVYSFEKHRGTHGGFYGQMCYPFVISRNQDIIAELNNPSMTMESLFSKIEYNMN